MGKGKGSIYNWITIIKKGQVIFEISGINFLNAKDILYKCSNQLPIKTKFIKLYYYFLK